MKEYNAAFFNLFQNMFLSLKDKFGEQEALACFREIMEKGLNEAYGDDFVKGSTESFANVVGERDKNVGLEVKFNNIQEDAITYEFHTDPFPKLKGLLPSHILDGIYMNFKVKHLLGDDWKYKTKSHLWDGAHCTQHHIYKEAA